MLGDPRHLRDVFPVFWRESLLGRGTGLVSAEVREERRVRERDCPGEGEQSPPGSSTGEVQGQTSPSFTLACGVREGSWCLTQDKHRR